MESSNMKSGTRLEYLTLLYVCFQNDICAAYLFQHCKSYMIHMIANNQMNSILLPADNQQQLHYKC